ncbi:hypothetical protein [Pedobacter helvus]|uniref:Uncharacterized protein n=1 Tax=Pedobacter helvus TaxID=2563444 RepID=A0ABW9JHN7_9SPHI|nr:hypothetical protein [Pedobacter ureilyticus]
MAQLYYASEESYKYIQQLNYGFYLDQAEDGNIAIMVKLEPGLLDSIISGCPMRLVIRNPNFLLRSCTLYVDDIHGDPFHATAIEIGQEDRLLKGFDERVLHLFSGVKQVVLSLYNELNTPIFSADIGIETDPVAFQQWLFKVYNDPEYRKAGSYDKRTGSFYPESQVKGFELRLLNKDHSKTEKMTIYSPDYDGLETLPDIEKSGGFRHSDYSGDGKHGRLQELAIGTKLSNFFVEGSSLFSSPRYADGLEMTDFLLLDKNAAILIESKYIISEKSTKRNDNIVKATQQLNRAEQRIFEGTAEMENPTLDQYLKDIDIVLKLCIINDRIHLDEKYAKQLASRFSKPELPTFISVTVFCDLLVGFYLKNPPVFASNVFSNLLRIQDEFMESQKHINYLQVVSIEGLSAPELNALWKNRQESGAKPQKKN